MEDVDNDDEEEELDKDVMEDGGAIELVVVVRGVAPITDVVVVAADVTVLDIVTGIAVVVTTVVKASVDIDVEVDVDVNVNDDEDDTDDEEHDDDDDNDDVEVEVDVDDVVGEAVLPEMLNPRCVEAPRL